MSRIRKVLVLVGVLTLIPVGSALAAKITGGSAQVTVSSATAQLLSSNGVTLQAVAPATESGNTLTFSVNHGRLGAKHGYGHVSLTGGISLTNGTSTVNLRDLTIVSDRHGVSVRALVVDHHERCRVVGRRHPHSVCHSHLGVGIARVATLSGATVNATSVSGTVDITQRAADLINRLAGKSIIQAGAELGTVTASLTTT
jgi:hypothetical protein